ncbi:hypothetical protein A2634_03825 [Candidatus Amesbacteria bacterium RIFCSPHIGHO2_01_FULL_48_32]|uniref:Cell division protein FtsL n=1 Tax=Candidatus Amesbacteria bacterium RIFCSPLOWO2_01_FULL_48_25 TaxID=1797259 RepID=A0A1F4ZB83_9BACT|nr:MAG: hypothetical protein A2634_03825 [Candidatus Amesbacteria bacterium RIFCSPHIGHO2_01_FULL_48_32]OGD03485.1 MAG: hypothetical protein A2989_02555 [Candidatus Amesbacteria bacterium RIFCSPLOWO2_01_FULL_48_25]HJZ05792.1 hypothetical protein [Patescibacteria group bacterium]
MNHIHKSRLLPISIFINVALLLGQFVLSSVRSSQGQLVWSLETRQEFLQNQNKELQSQIYHLSSVQYLSQSAQSRHLVPIRTETITPPSMASLP